MDDERITYRALLLHLHDHQNEHAGRDWSESTVADLREEWRSCILLDAYVECDGDEPADADAIEDAYGLAFENECAILSNEFGVSTCFTVCDCHDDEGRLAQ